MNLYQSGLDTKGCAIVMGPNGPAMNRSCEMVHRHICAASAGAVKARADSGRPDLAQKLKEMLVRDFGCPAGQLY